MKRIKTTVKELLNSKIRRVKNEKTTTHLDKINNCSKLASIEKSLKKYTCYNLFLTLKTTEEKIKFIDNFYHLTKINNYSIDSSDLLKCKDCLYLILEDCLKTGDKILITNIKLVFYLIFAIKDFDKEIYNTKLKYVAILKKYNNIELLNEFNSAFQQNS